MLTLVDDALVAADLPVKRVAFRHSSYRRDCRLLFAVPVRRMIEMLVSVGTIECIIDFV